MTIFSRAMCFCLTPEKLRFSQSMIRLRQDLKYKWKVHIIVNQYVNHTMVFEHYVQIAKDPNTSDTVLFFPHYRGVYLCDSEIGYGFIETPLYPMYQELIQQSKQFDYVPTDESTFFHPDIKWQQTFRSTRNDVHLCCVHFGVRDSDSGELYDDANCCENGSSCQYCEYEYGEGAFYLGLVNHTTQQYVFLSSCGCHPGMDTREVKFQGSDGSTEFNVAKKYTSGNDLITAIDKMFEICVQSYY